MCLCKSWYIYRPIPRNPRAPTNNLQRKSFASEQLTAVLRMVKVMDAPEIFKLIGIIVCFFVVIVGTAKVLRIYSTFSDPVLKKITNLVILISAVPCCLRLVALCVSLIYGKQTNINFVMRHIFKIIDMNFKKSISLIEL